MLSRKIEALTNAVMMSKQQSITTKLPDSFKLDIPAVKIPPFPPLPKLEVAPIDTRGIERAIERGLGSIKQPNVKVDAPIVNVPAANITVESAPVEFPKEMKVEGIKEIKEGIEAIVNKEERNPFDGISHKKPLPMIILDASGKQVSNFGGDMTAPSVVALKTGTTQVSATNPLPVAEGFQLDQYDYISLSYTGDNLTSVVYKTGGASGTTVATLTIAYSGSNITSVTKT